MKQITPEFKYNIVLGSVDIKQFKRFENGRMVSYGYSIHRDRYGVETSRTEPEAYGSIGWDNGAQFTEKDYHVIMDGGRGLSWWRRMFISPDRESKGSSI